MPTSTQARHAIVDRIQPSETYARHDLQPRVSEADSDPHHKLLRQIAAGEQQALGQFYELTVSRVYGLCVRLIGESADAEEAVADTYVQVWQQAKRHEAKRGSVIAWLLVIARSRSIDLLRREQRRRRGRVHSGDEALAHIADEQAPAEELLDTLQQGSRAKLALVKLTRTQRDLITLAFLEDLSHQEIAERLNMPLGTVKSNLRRGLAAMRRTLAPAR